MAKRSGFRDVVRGWIAPACGVASLLLLLGAAACTTPSHCQKIEPADEFSEKIDSLLMAVEGPGFPTDANLDTWPERKGDIRARFVEIIELASSDVPRRKAPI